MPPNTPNTLPFEQRGTNPAFKTAAQSQFEQLQQKKRDCEAKGGIWDEGNQTCNLSQDPAARLVTKLKNQNLGKLPETAPETPERAPLTTPEVFENQRGITIPDGRTFLGLNTDDVANVAELEQRRTLPPGTQPVGTAQAQLEAGIRAQQLQSQVGQFQQGPISPTGLDIGEAATTGIIESIPSAIRLGFQGALAGGIIRGGAGVAGAPITGGLSIAGGAAIGAIGGFIAGITSSMLSNFAEQRRDTTTAQQRVLDEGKQTMKDWVTLAESDPANKVFYLAQYNKVLSQIDQAYRQMKLDTNRDVVKFETALPSLAEFEAFYAAGGEKDTLNFEMRNALAASASPEYKMLELSNRRLPNGINLNPNPQ